MISRRAGTALLATLVLTAGACASDGGDRPVSTPTTDRPEGVSIDFDATEDVDANTEAFAPTEDRQKMTGIAGSGTGFAAVGYEYKPVEGGGEDTFRARTWFSPDGINWERKDLAETGRMRDVVAFDGGFVAVGSIDTGTSDGAIWTSDDGREWEHLAEIDGEPVDDTFGIGLKGITAVGNELYATGFDLSSAESRNATATVWKSADGSDWTKVAAGDALLRPGETAVGDAIAADSDVFVIAGEGSGLEGVEPVIWCSDNGEDWTHAEGPDLYSGDFPFAQGPRSEVVAVDDVAAGDSGFVAVGTTEGGPRVWHSDDGCTWTQPDVDLSAVNQLTAVGSDGSRYTMGGYMADDETGPATSALWQSDDGQNWEKLPFEDDDVANASGRMEAVAVFGNGDIAVGSDGADASTWTVSLD